MLLRKLLLGLSLTLASTAAFASTTPNTSTAPQNSVYASIMLGAGGSKITAGGMSVSGDGLAYGFALGYHMPSAGGSLEVGYLSLPTINDRYGFYTSTINDYMVYVATKVSAHFNKQLGGYLKIGVGSVMASNNDTSRQASEVGILIGTGLFMPLSPNVKISLGADYAFTNSGDYNSIIGRAGLTFTFN